MKIVSSVLRSTAYCLSVVALISGGTLVAMKEVHNTNYAIKPHTGSVVIQADGKIIDSENNSSTKPYSQQAFARIRYASLVPFGKPFNEMGLAVPPELELRYALLMANKKTVLKDGKILVVGKAYKKDNYVNSYFVIARFNADSTVDRSFTNGEFPGFIIGAFDPKNPFSTADAGIVENDGKIFVAGLNNSFLAFARLNSDGSFDKTFGSTGSMITNKEILFKMITLDIELVA